jgi:hypothetical protein
LPQSPNITTAWVLSELPKYINTEYLNEYFGGRIGPVLQLAAIGRSLCGKPDDFTLENGESIYEVASTVPEYSPNIVIPPKWKAGKIEPIPSGLNIFQWPNWKEGELATFAQCALYRVITDPDFASSNPDMNAIVSGMFTTVLSKEDAPMLYTTVGYLGNGH